MITYYLRSIPSYSMNGFVPVRSSIDNLYNIINVIDIIKTFEDKISKDSLDDFDLAIFTGPCNRALVRNGDGYFTMTIPFQIIDNGKNIDFNYDLAETKVDWLFLYIIRKAIEVSKDNGIDSDDISLAINDSFDLDFTETKYYSNIFFNLLSEDHGYFRFDDDPVNENGEVHPRYHFDFFFRNTSSVKIGVSESVSIEYFLSLFDKSKPKMFLTKKIINI